MAGALGVKLALEVLPNELSGARSLVHFVEDDLEGTDVGICLDFGHAHLDGDIVDAVEMVSEHLIANHVHDNGGRTDDHLVPFEGTIDEKRSTEMEPYFSHTKPEPLKPGEVYRFDISIEPNAFQFKKGNRIRLEVVNGDSPITDVLWTHYYQTNKIGQDTLYHSARYPSALVLPVME